MYSYNELSLSKEDREYFQQLGYEQFKPSDFGGPERVVLIIPKFFKGTLKKTCTVE